MSVKQNLPIGFDNFRKLREADKYYIDKTMMIKDFIEYNDEVALICRPRRFGKTLNMTMIRDFFDITQDSHDIFDGLAIMDTEYASQINSRPVIYFTFKDCNADNVQDFEIKFCRIMSDEYSKYYKLALSHKKEIEKFEVFENLYKAMNIRQARLSELTEAIALLEEVVYLIFKKEPIVLLDEYDRPIMSAHENGFHPEVSNFISDFYGSALKGQDHLGNALLTGIQRVAKESIFSKLNNIKVYTVIQEKYAPYFGLTTEETEAILADYDLELNENVRRMYDGYHIGEYDIYNPWSILYYCDEKFLRSYWVNTSSNSIIRDFLKAQDKSFLDDFYSLIENGSVSVIVNLETSYTEKEIPATLWGLFINAGYLTVQDRPSGDILTVRIPNCEVKEEFKSIVGESIGDGNGHFQLMSHALVSGDYDTFISNYKKLIRTCVSYYDVSDASLRYENPYHMLTLGMVLSLDYIYDIKSNYESGDGRADIRMVSKKPEKCPHIIMEFKRTDDIIAGAEEALQQIIEKRYAEDLIERCKTEGGHVLYMGISHDSKKCEIKTLNVI